MEGKQEKGKFRIYNNKKRKREEDKKAVKIK